MQRVDLKEHEKSCHYRTIPCLIYGCKELYPISSYMDHLKEKHKSGDPKVSFQLGSGISLQTDYIGKFRNERDRHPDDQDRLLRKIRYLNLQLNGNQFLVEIMASQSVQEFEDGTCFMTFNTKILTTGEEAKNYRVFIKVFNASKVSVNCEVRNK